ncbi:hypothetical protein Tco_0815801 [Tanacetum coccineum]
MHTYVSRLKDTELKSLIATYDIPLDLRPRLPDPNFRMINLQAKDTAIGIYSRIFYSSGVRIPFSSFLLAVLKYFKVHISQLVPLGLSKVITFEVLCRSLNIEPTVTLFRVFQTLSKQGDWFSFAKRGGPAPVCMEVAKSGLKLWKEKFFLIHQEIAVTRPDRNIVTKADLVAKRKASTRPEISTNTAKRTRLSQKVSRAGSSGLAAGDGVEQTDDGTLDDDGQRDGSEFSMEDIGNLNDASQGLCLICFSFRYFLYAGVSEDASSPAQEAVPAPDTQALDIDAGTDEIASDGNVDPYFDARVSNTARDVLEKDLLPFVPGPYYIPYPFDEGSKELYKDPKVCRTALDRFPTPVETHRLRELSSVELSDRMSVLQCQLITHGSMLNARYDHSLKNVDRLTKRCAQQTQIIKKQGADLKQQKESTVRANEEVSRNERDTLSTEKVKIEGELVGTKSQLEHHERQAKEIQGSIASFFQSDFTPLVRRFLKSSEFNRVFAGVLNTAISVGVERGLRKDRTDEEFRRLLVSQHSQSSLQDIARLEPDRVTPSSQPSSAIAPLRANTHVRHSTSSPGTFGHNSNPEHLKKNKKFVEKVGPLVA